MMYGSFLYNCWGALIGFTIYFLVALQGEFTAPWTILIGSFIVGAVMFIVTYGLRYLLGYVLYTPEPLPLPQQEVDGMQTNGQERHIPSRNQATSAELNNGNAEEIANVVKTMMHQEEQQRVQNA